ncbi:hypothetical protein G6O69_11505 [Pseudenhygromyxa sp. WMMC2535]|uniref:hypothetical protein n=1 Tax=Pseudenhygromyxa sp. WMMC2535 TaxID=2712867 RepID=UPI00155357D5|nr:hypothetical protein [Pseudenhygromyxa sp. WMMC2535]NVB38459.1 hypothetical protein [Pseudenhygromyxa sp. WMMC2535]
MSHDHQGDEQHCGEAHRASEASGGGPNTDFLDLEISQVLYAEAEGVTREAFRELLKEAAKRQWQARWGERIEALAKLAVDELLEDMAANLEIEARIAARNAARGAVQDRASQLIQGTPESPEPGEDTSGDGQG